MLQELFGGEFRIEMKQWYWYYCSINNFAYQDKRAQGICSAWPGLGPWACVLDAVGL